MENKQLNLSEPENIMGTMDVNPLLIKLSIPMMISMLVQALYNVVDSIFVARVSENALTAVSLAFSLQNMMFAVGIGTGVGQFAARLFSTSFSTGVVRYIMESISVQQNQMIGSVMVTPRYPSLGVSIITASTFPTNSIVDDITGTIFLPIPMHYPRNTVGSFFLQFYVQGSSV